MEYYKKYLKYKTKYVELKKLQYGGDDWYRHSFLRYCPNIQSDTKAEEAQLDAIDTLYRDPFRDGVDRLNRLYISAIAEMDKGAITCNKLREEIERFNTDNNKTLTPLEEHIIHWPQNIKHMPKDVNKADLLKLYEERLTTKTFNNSTPMEPDNKLTPFRLYFIKNRHNYCRIDQFQNILKIFAEYYNTYTKPTIDDYETKLRDFDSKKDPLKSYYIGTSYPEKIIYKKMIICIANILFIIKYLEKFFPQCRSDLDDKSCPPIKSSSPAPTRSSSVKSSGPAPTRSPSVKSTGTSHHNDVHPPLTRKPTDFGQSPKSPHEPRALERNPTKRRYKSPRPVSGTEA